LGSVEVGAVIPEFVGAAVAGEAGGVPAGEEGGEAAVCAKAKPDRQRILPAVKRVVILFTEPV
jgi:hypothetical protein